MARRSRARRTPTGGRGAVDRGMPGPSSQPLGEPPDRVVGLLARAEVLAHQAVPAGTNYTFVLLMSAPDRGRFLAVYKPRRGENPLWDFPRGTLYLRERAAYVASRHLGWPNIPATVVRDGPFGVGSVQLFVPTDGQPDFFAFRLPRRRELEEVALFDLLANNADRKAGHCLLGVDGRVWAIDHGLTFNVEPKLRTVLWDFCGEPIPERLLDGLARLHEDPTRRERLRLELEPCLDTAEIVAFFARLERVLRSRTFPQLDPHRNVPWPLV